MRVLLAEDSVVNQRLACGLLERKGHTVAIAANGKQALEMVQQTPFDIVLMDVQMPEMNGLEASQAIRQWESTKGSRIPIIALTGNETENDRQQCLAAGMDDYIAKPIRSTELFEKIDRLLQLPATPLQPAAAEPPAIQQPSGRVTIDWEQALKGLAGKRDLLSELVDLYCVEAPRLLQQANEALSNTDAVALRIAAHTLKGSSRYFGPTRVGELAAHLEELATNSDEFTAAEQTLQQLASALDALLPELKKFNA